MQILFVAGFGPVVADMPAARAFYGEALGLTLEGDDSYLSVPPGLDGVKHFALWPLAGAAESCFGSPEWPREIPVPQGWLEFDVTDVAAATDELETKGYKVLVRARQEPWSQTVSRLLSPEGLLVGVTYTPAMRSGDA